MPDLIKKTQPSLTYILKEIEKNRKLPVEERDYLYLYLSLENFIVNSDLGYTKESLREVIREQFNVKWFEPRISLLFNKKDPDNLVFSLIILESILKHLNQNLSPGLIQRIVNEITKNQLIRDIIIKEVIDFTTVEKRIFSNEKEFPMAIDKINKLISNLYTYSTQILGASKTEEIFNSAFNEIKRKYIDIPKFAETVRALPQGILEVEKFSLLSKEELEEVSKKLAKIDTMKSEFTNIAAHELKTPLVPITGFLSILLKDRKKFKLTKRVQEHLEICLRNAKRLNSLIEDILSISKLESGEMKFYMENLNLKKIIDNAQKDLLYLAKEKNLSLNLKLPQYLPLVRGDEQRITQVLINLINNAIKFTNKGSITISAKQTGNKIIIQVKDTGIGIDKNDIPKLFIKYYQGSVSQTKKQKGLGLGLAICKEIIKQHKGAIWVESELGKGSSFYFTLPIRK